MQRATLGGFLVALAACGSSVTESLTTGVDAGDDSTSEDPSSTGVSVTAASMSVSDDGSSVSAGSGDSDPSEDTGGSGSEAGSGNGDAGSDDGPAESGSDGAAESEGGTTDAESTGEPVDCAPLDEAACVSAGDACMVLAGAPLVHENGPWWCIGDDEFAGCAESSACTRAQTVACEDGGTAWLFPTGCLPSGWSPCDAPGNGDYDACG